MMFLGRGAEMVEDDAGFNAGDAARGVDFEDARHVFRKVEDDRGVAALSGKRSASAAGEQRSPLVAAESNRREHVFLVARNYDADGNLAVIRAVGRVEGAAAGIEANFSAKMAAESGFERRGVKLHGMGRGWGDILRHGVQNIFEDAGVGRKGERSQEKLFGSSTGWEYDISAKKWLQRRLLLPDIES